MGSRIDKFINLAQSNIKPNKLSTNQKGTIGEHQCIADYTRQGYWVAQSCNPQCPFDLVLVSPDGKIELVDIKTNTYRKNVKSYRRKIWRIPSAKQKKLGIKILMVDHGN